MQQEIDQIKPNNPGIFRRMNGMQHEIDQLKANLAEMSKNIGFDDELFDDLDEFDKKVSQWNLWVIINNMLWKWIKFLDYFVEITHKIVIIQNS